MKKPEVLRLEDIPRSESFVVKVDGIDVAAYAGETVAALLASMEQRVFYRRTMPYPANRLYCNMGVCMQCLLSIDGQENVRACLTQVKRDMEIRTRR